MKKYMNIIFVIIVITALASFNVVTNKNIPKVAYVDLATIYNNFPMKKELEGKLTNVQHARKNILDSLKIKLNDLSMAIKSPKDEKEIRAFQVQKQEYLMKQKNFEEDNQAATQNYT